MSPCERTAHLIALRQMELQLRRAAAAARQEALLDLLSGLSDRLNAVTFESAYLRRPDLQVVLDAGAGLSADTPLEGLESWIESATVAQRRSEAYLNEAKRSERRHLARRLIRERMSVGSAEIGKQVVVEQGERASSRERNGHPSQLEKEESINRQAEIEALVEMFPVESSSRGQARINSILERLAGASTIEFPSLVVAAKAEIRSVERSVAQRRERHRRAGELLRGLDGLPGLEVDAARSRLQRVLDGRTELLQVDVDFAHRARSTGVKEIERRYMATQLHQAFRETGVMVGSEFVSEVLNRDEAYLASRFSADHAVAVRLSEGLVDLRVVRGAGHPDPKRDYRAQVEFCKDVDHLRAELRRREVNLEMVNHHPPGTVPVDLVPDARRVLRRRYHGEERARYRTPRS